MIGRGKSLLAALTLYCSAYPGPARAQQFPVPTIAYERPHCAHRREVEVKGAKLLNMARGTMGRIQTWSDKSDSVSWQTDAARTGDYEISAIVQAAAKTVPSRSL